MNADWMRSLIKSSAVPSSSATSLVRAFVEKVYENALAHELRSASLAVAQQYAIAVRYKDIIVGEYVADLLVANEIIMELKAVRPLDEIHAAQCMNYLKATGLRVCLLFNFGKPRVEVRRIVLGF